MRLRGNMGGCGCGLAALGNYSYWQQYYGPFAGEGLRNWAWTTDGSGGIYYAANDQYATPISFSTQYPNIYSNGVVYATLQQAQSAPRYSAPTNVPAASAPIPSPAAPVSQPTSGIQAPANQTITNCPAVYDANGVMIAAPVSIYGPVSSCPTGGLNPASAIPGGSGNTAPSSATVTNTLVAYQPPSPSAPVRTGQSFEAPISAPAESGGFPGWLLIVAAAAAVALIS